MNGETRRSWTSFRKHAIHLYFSLGATVHCFQVPKATVVLNVRAKDTPIVPEKDFEVRPFIAIEYRNDRKVKKRYVATGKTDSGVR